MPESIHTPPLIIFGGSFDPFHLGHYQMITTLLKLSSIQMIWVVPAFLSPFKIKNFFTPQQRLHWIEMTLSDLPKDCIQISHFELSKQRSVPTIESLQYFRAFYPHAQFGCVIGEDQLPHLHRWFGFEQLRQEVTFLIFGRQGYGDYPKEIFKTIHYQWFDYEYAISAAQIREGLMKGDESVLQHVSPLIVQEFHLWLKRD